MRAILALALVAACGGSKPSSGSGAAAKPMDPNAPLPVACKVSEDCTLVQACCGCNAGGKQIALRADAAASFEASRPQRCGAEMCAAVMSTDPSCSAEATCGQNGRCNVTPHMQSQ